MRGDALAAREGALGGALAAAAAAEAEAGRTARAREAADAAMPPLRENAARGRGGPRQARGRSRAGWPIGQPGPRRHRGGAAPGRRGPSATAAGRRRCWRTPRPPVPRWNRKQATLAEAEAGADATLDRLRAGGRHGRSAAGRRGGAARPSDRRGRPPAGRQRIGQSGRGRCKRGSRPGRARHGRRQQEVATAGRRQRPRARPGTARWQRPKRRNRPPIAPAAALDVAEAVLAAARQAETAAARRPGRGRRPHAGPRSRGDGARKARRSPVPKARR